MPSAVWTVLVAVEGRSLVEIREDGLLWVRQDMTLADAQYAVNQLAALYATNQRIRKEPNASH